MITTLSSKPFPMICIMVLQWHALPDHGHSDIVLVLTGTEACPRLRNRVSLIGADIGVVQSFSYAHSKM